MWLMQKQLDEAQHCHQSCEASGDTCWCLFLAYGCASHVRTANDRIAGTASSVWGASV